MVDISKQLAEADEIFDQDRLLETIELLKSLDQWNVQVLWRLARAKYQLIKIQPSKAKKAEVAKKGLDFATTALEVDDKCAEAHLFYASLLDASSEIHSIRARAMRLTDVKKHIARAVELNPYDAMSRYALGVFMYEVRDMGWFTRKIVEAVFTKPPDASYEEALEHFLIAEEIEPDFYSRNKLMIAKSCIALRDYESARPYLIKVASVKIKCEDDHKAVREAQALLARYT